MSEENTLGRDGTENHGNIANLGNQILTLAVETSSRIGSVALALGDHLIEEAAFSSPMQHSAEMFPAIEGLLARHGHTPPDIEQVHISVGPGSFTGLRIAVTLAKAMHLAQGVKIVTVDSLDVVAANLADPPQDPAAGPGEPLPDPLPERIAALFDAKRGQFYASIYDRVPPEAGTPADSAEDAPGYRIPAPNDAIWRKIHPDSLMTAREIMDGFARASSLGVLGDGLLYHREEFSREGIMVLPERYWSPRAANVHRLGWQKAFAGRFTAPLALTPFYLRGPQVTLRRRP
jgi:tRNA threonylcarbamoyl adenosine modification protein YeaZ